MTTYLTSSELASFLDTPVSGAIDRIVLMTNALIDEKWADPVNPVPQSIINIAWAVAVRAGANPRGLSSWTRSWDDITRTERMEQTRAAGVFLTADELAALNPHSSTRTTRSIRLRLPWT